MTTIKAVGSSQNVMQSVDEFVSLVNQKGGNVVMIGLACVYLTYRTWNNLKRYWNGEISGKRLAKVSSYLPARPSVLSNSMSIIPLNLIT